MYCVKYFCIESNVSSYERKKIGIKSSVLLDLTDSYAFADRQIASVAMARGR